MRAVAAVVGHLLGVNVMGGVVFGVWLAIVGDWWTIGLGLILFWGGRTALGVALLPMALGATYFEHRQLSPPITIVVSTLSNLYLAALMTTWSLGVLYVLLDAAVDAPLVPVLGWAFGVAILPWGLLATRADEGNGGPATVAVFFGWIAFLAMVGYGYFVSATTMNLLLAYGTVMSLYVVLMTGHAAALLEASALADPYHDPRKLTPGGYTVS